MGVSQSELRPECRGCFEQSDGDEDAEKPGYDD